MGANDKPRAGELINVLREAKQEVPEELLKFGTTGARGWEVSRELIPEGSAGHASLFSHVASRWARNIPFLRCACRALLKRGRRRAGERAVASQARVFNPPAAQS